MLNHNVSIVNPFTIAVFLIVVGHLKICGTSTEELDTSSGGQEKHYNITLQYIQPNNGLKKPG